MTARQAARHLRGALLRWTYVCVVMACAWFCVELWHV